MSNNNPINQVLNRFILDPIYKKVREDIEKNNLREKQLALFEPQTSLYNVNVAMMNSRTTPKIKNKEEGAVNQQTLRDFSVSYPIARACIDHLKSSITQLKWDITTEDKEIKPDIEVTSLLKQFFKKPNVYDNVRTFLEQIIEDYLVLGAVSLERQFKGSDVVAYLPVDSSTIVLKCDERGRIPLYPSIAYEQWIQGSKKAELTTRELKFCVRNSRANSLYGLSPLESLIIQVRSALEGALYNYEFYQSGNMPEGLVGVPESWDRKKIEEFQTYFDTLLSGDMAAQRRLKFVPGEIAKNYTPVKKPNDLPFEKFEMWLLQQTCAMFGVQPQDLGFTADVNRSTADSQNDKSHERGKRPLADFIEETFTEIIQNDLGFNSYCFKFIDIDPKDRKEEAEIERIRIESGVLGVDEVRINEGMKPIGLKNYIKGSVVLVDDLINPKPELKPNNIEIDNEENAEKIELMNLEFKKWKKAVINDFSDNKSFRDFKTKYIDLNTTKKIKNGLTLVKTKDDIRELFNPYLNGEYRAISKLKLLNETLKTIGDM